MKQQEIKEIISKIPKDKYFDIFSDAWTIFSPNAFTKLGFPKDYIDRFEKKFKSNGTSKGNIYVDGKVVDHVSGVMSMTVAYDIAKKLKLHDAIDSSNRMNGRGFALDSLSYPIWDEVQNN